jgi:DNA-binding transcriptional LysR family regulator
MNIELRDLEYFLASVENGGVTAAARRLHAAQPTVSHALARLEAQLGHRLLDRAPRTVPRVTDAGALVVDAARTAIGAVALLSERLAELDGVRTGHVRVVATPSLTVTLIPRVLSTFARTHAGIGVSVATLAAEQIAPCVDAGEADVGVVAGAGPVRAALERRHLYRERFVAVVAESDPLGRRRTVPLAALRDRPLLLTPADTPMSIAVHAACARAGFEPKVALTLASAEGLRECARAGLGVAVLPAGYVAVRERGVVGVPIVRPELSREVHVIQRGRHRLATPRAAQAMVEVLERVARSGSELPRDASRRHRTPRS